VLVCLAATPASAHDVKAGDLTIGGPWARATPKGASVGAGYMTITNAGTTTERLIGGTSDGSSRFEVHEMSMDGGVMKMREMTKGIEIKPGQTVEFKPGGYHVMFVGLNKQLESGQQIKAMLNFEKAGKVEVGFHIRAMGESGAPMHGH
jgi:copper(I)-binding protein